MLYKEYPLTYNNHSEVDLPIRKEEKNEDFSSFFSLHNLLEFLRGHFVRQ